MATKARFYKVTTRNGRGEDSKIVSAPKKSVIPSVFENENIKVTNVEHLGFKEVITDLNYETEAVEFKVPELGDLKVQHNNVGYKSLELQFDEQVSEAYKDLEKYHNGEY